MLDSIIEICITFFLVFGAAFVLLGSLGLAKFRDIFTRLHAPTKASTLGVGSILVASTIAFSTARGGLSLHEILITVFLFMTAPVSAYLLAKAALHERADDQWPHETKATDAELDAPPDA
jgi:multicomponent K+:H+ antiporter subunit G